MNIAAVPACLDLPTDELLAVGADSRSRAGSDGLTEYGTGASPREAVPFGSCTASSPIQRVYDAAVSEHRLLREARVRGELACQVHASYRRIKDALYGCLSIDARQGVSITLTPSGTDAEFLALMLALGDRSRPLCNIIVGPREVGSGSGVAAAGLHFDSVVPHGAVQAKETPVSPEIAGLVCVETIPLRDSDGRVREPEDLDAATDALARAALAKGERVLIHVVAHSKTGVHAPSISMVRRLARAHAPDLAVVVDAAQGRFSRQGLLAALADGFMVLLTGSKFYGGPPFSGALLVPERHSPVVQRLPHLPAEFGSYFSRWDFPEDWEPFAAKLPQAFNLGLLLRWAAAEEAMRAYYSVPGDARFSILRRFEQVVPREYAKFPWFELDRVPPVQFPAGEERLLESKTTVFPFRMRRPMQSGRPQYLLNAELKRVGRWLNEDISHLAVGESPETKRALASRFHLGQPVFKGDSRHPAVLRLALGAALVSETGSNPAYGASLEERLDWLEGMVRAVLSKLDWIHHHHATLAAR